MKWIIPAKTFLLGEYAAIGGAPAILLTTFPCFELTLTNSEEVKGIHADSPAGRWWTHHRIPGKGVEWFDPYHGQGGLGASSAQFLGVYLASCQLHQITPNLEVLLKAYHQTAWSGEGLKPSGYDLWAQTQNHCVYINQGQKELKAYDWVFKDVAFLIVRTRNKVSTHQHLQSMQFSRSIRYLATFMKNTQASFAQNDSGKLIDAINSYQHKLETLKLSDPATQKLVQKLMAANDILAAKGCGALGADTLLLIIPSTYLDIKVAKLIAEGWTVLATNRNLYNGPPLLEINPHKHLNFCFDPV